MRRILFDYLFNGITIIAAIIAIVTSDLFGGFENENFVALGLISFFAIYFFGNNIWLRIKWGRSSKYADALCYMANGFSEIHSVIRSETSDFQAIDFALASFCDYLANAFTLISGTKCSTSIRMLKWDEDKNGNTGLKTISISRDRNSKSKRNNKSDEVIHWIDKNSDFKKIYENHGKPIGRYFFSNKLPLEYSYLNTSFQLYGDPEDKFIPPFSQLLRIWRWPLPYRSTIVVPISPLKGDAGIKGFLCIDSSKMFSFSKTNDIDFLGGAADGLYNLMEQVDPLGYE